MDRATAPVLLPAPRRGNFVLLRADALWLLLPQHEVGAVEYLDAPPEPTAATGLHKQSHAGSTRRLAALSSRMHVLAHFPTDRVLLTALAGTPIAWCWSEVKVLIDVSLQPRSLPGVLHTPHMPVHEYVEHDDGIAFLCSAQRLCAFALRTDG